MQIVQKPVLIHEPAMPVGWPSAPGDEHPFSRSESRGTPEIGGSKRLVVF